MSKFCLYCGESLLAHSKFCHCCGQSVMPVLQKCTVCYADNPAQARFCATCGNKMQSATAKNNSLQNRYHLNLSEIATLPTQFKIAFLNYFKVNLLNDGFENYAERTSLLFEQSDFRILYFEEQSLTWANDAVQEVERYGKNALVRIETALSIHFSAAYLTFCSQFTKPNLPFSLPEKVVKYEYQIVENISLAQLVNDYFNDLQHNFYLNVIDIPLQKLKQIRQSYFKPLLLDETPVFYLEQSANSGILLSEYAIYWKMSFHKSAVIAYKDIQTVKNFHDYIYLNDIYINIDKDTNFRLFKLLQKLQQIFQS